MWILYASVVLVIISFIYFTFFKKQDYWEKRNVPAKSANGFLFGKGMIQLLQEVYDYFPDKRYVGIYQGTEASLMIRDPELIRQITVKDFEHFTDHRTLIKGNNEPLWSRNLISLNGQQWKDMRSILSPSYTGSKMRLMHPLIIDCAKTYVKHLVEAGPKEYDTKDVFSRFTNDVIATTAFGVEVDSWKNKNNEFYLMGKSATNFKGFFTMLRFMVLFLFPKAATSLDIKMFNKKCSEFFTNLVKNAIEIREKNNIVRPDMINILMEAKKENPNAQLSLEDMTAQVLIFFFAGFESVANTICFTLHELAVNPNIQEKLRNEIKNCVKNENNITYESLWEMKYMDMVIMESLRKYPAGVLLDRRCTKAYVIEPKNIGETPVTIEEGTPIFFPIISIQNDPILWPNPKLFDPERFSESTQEAVNNCLHLGFGNGPRHCIGKRFAMMEMKTILTLLLLNLEFKVSSKTVVPMKLHQFAVNVTADPGFFLEIVPLKKEP